MNDTPKKSVNLGQSDKIQRNITKIIEEE